MKPSLPPSGHGGRVGERVDVWTLRVMSIAVEALLADVPDNRPLSDVHVGWPGLLNFIWVMERIVGGRRYPGRLR
jgi:hypothetical protein